MTQYNIIDIFGYAGSMMYTLMLIPQIYKVYKNKEAKSLSYLMMLISFVGTSFMLVYSVGIGSIPVTISNSLYGLSTIILFWMKYYFDVKLINNQVPNENN